MKVPWDSESTHFVPLMNEESRYGTFNGRKTIGTSAERLSWYMVCFFCKAEGLVKKSVLDSGDEYLRETGKSMASELYFWATMICTLNESRRTEQMTRTAKNAIMKLLPRYGIRSNPWKDHMYGFCDIQNRAVLKRYLGASEKLQSGLNRPVPQNRSFR